MSSAYRRLPFRWRLAGGSAALTFTILVGFALLVGVLTTRQIRSDFDQEVSTTATELAAQLTLGLPGLGQQDGGVQCFPDLNTYARADHAAIRVIRYPSGEVLCATKSGPSLPIPTATADEVDGYRVESRRVPFALPGSQTVMQYARPTSTVTHTQNRVRAFLALGVIGGTLLALLAGLLVARRAVRPITELTSAAREIERTRDPGRSIPQPEADDEIAELAATLEAMLHSLDAARAETESALARQREFVADASHELRTPLTSVLANLELLAEALHDEQRLTATAALRSAQRMRRLVADLLLLARADAGRKTPRTSFDLAEVVADAAGELEPVAGVHRLSVSTEPAPVEGARDELHRVALNLMENALRHTPAGTAVRAGVSRSDGVVTLTVEDDGPGIAPELAARVFERFVRGSSDAGGGSGLGLAIVRAVAEAHGGSVELDGSANGSGARFVVKLPAA